MFDFCKFMIGVDRQRHEFPHKLFDLSFFAHVNFSPFQTFMTPG